MSILDEVIREIECGIRREGSATAYYRSRYMGIDRKWHSTDEETYDYRCPPDWDSPFNSHLLP